MICRAIQTLSFRRCVSLKEIESKNIKNRRLIKGILLVILSAFCSSFGQLIWKMIPTFDFPAFIGYFFGLFFYGMGALLLIVAFRFGEMSILHPMLSFGFVFAIIWSSIFLKEDISVQKLIGTALIIAGVIVLAVGNAKSAHKEKDDGDTV